MRRRLHLMVMAVAFAGSMLVLLGAQWALAYQVGWLDRITEYVLMQKAITTEGSFQPYLDQLKQLRGPVSRGDWVGTYQGMTHFMDMLEADAGGIPRKTADAIWDFCYRVVPMDLHTEHQHIRAMGRDAYQQWKARQEYAEWHAAHAF